MRRQVKTGQSSLAAVLGLGLLLTCVGIVGTTAYAVARRTAEVGLRMALGAQPRQMVGTIVRDAVVPLALGIPIGLGCALGVTRVIETFLYETTPTDPLTFVITIIALTSAAVMAAWIPARHAAHVDPLTALRAE